MATRLARRTFLGGLAALAGAALVGPAIRPARADEIAGDDWERTGPDRATDRLFAPSSGALFATAGGLLFRSDDAGESWREVALPPPAGSARRELLVHPLDHRVVLASGAEGLYRSDDDAQTWRVILPGPRAAIRLAASRADPSLVFAGLVSGPSHFWLLRSRDGGETWDTLDERQNTLCGWGVPILQPHPSDPARVLRAGDCYAGRDFSDDLEESRDGGASWSPILRPRLAFPVGLVGGAGADPGRWYLAANRDNRSGGSVVFASADDGATWQEIVQHEGGGSMEHGRPNVRVGGLAYDPARPGRVYVALNRSVGPTWQPTHQGSGVAESHDAGASWTDLGRQDLPPIADLALGIDGRWLFAAGAEGVWRLPL
jgi:photosystem II stability/assembly factor-like uncharacterized protein